jgi:hypothetical protein
LQVFDAAGELLGQFSEIGRLNEVGRRQLLRRRTAGRGQQRQGRFQIGHRQR